MSLFLTAETHPVKHFPTAKLKQHINVEVLYQMPLSEKNIESFEAIMIW